MTEAKSAKSVSADDRVERVTPLSNDTYGTPDTQPGQPEDALLDHQSGEVYNVDKDSQLVKDAAKALKDHEKLD